MCLRSTGQASNDTHQPSNPPKLQASNRLTSKQQVTRLTAQPLCFPLNITRTSQNCWQSGRKPCKNPPSTYIILYPLIRQSRASSSTASAGSSSSAARGCDGVDLSPGEPSGQTSGDK